MERGSGGDDRKVGVVGAGELGRSGIVASTDQLTSSHCAALVGGDVRMIVRGVGIASTCTSYTYST